MFSQPVSACPFALCVSTDRPDPDLYLLHPPSDAVHSPVDPRKLVFAGDSAGGGLCLAVLTVIRDLGLPMPAGAVLISPWVDLTHSFPSVMENITKAGKLLFDADLSSQFGSTGYHP